MSNTHSSPSDELGSGNTITIARKIEDIAVNDATNNRWILNRSTGYIDRRAQIAITQPILITAGDSIRLRNGVNFNNLFVYVNVGLGPMFIILPMKRGNISVFSDSGGLVQVTSNSHGLNTGDVIKIVDSRVSTYNGDHTITFVDANNFTLDGSTFVSGSGATAESFLDGIGDFVERISITARGSDYVAGATISFDGAPTTPAIAKAVIDDGELVRVDIIDGGSGYASTVPTVTVTAYPSTDGRCEWIQKQLFVSAAADGGSGTIDLTSTAHPFATGDWINLYDTLGAGLDATYQITDVPDANTITITATFASTFTAFIDTGIGTYDCDHELLVGVIGVPSLPKPTLFNLAGSNSPIINTFHLSLRSLWSGFDLGEVRDFSIFSMSLNSLISESNNLRAMDNGAVDYQNLSAQILNDPFDTEDYQSVFNDKGGGNSSVIHNNYTISIPDNIASTTIGPDLSANNLRADLRNIRLFTPSTYFATGLKGRASDQPTSGGVDELVIPLSDTIQYRIGDIIELSESTNYNSQRGTIIAIVDDTSIEIDNVAFVAAPSTTTNTTVVDNGDGTIDIDVVSAVGFVVGDVIEIAGATPTSYNARYKIRDIVSNTFTITATSAGNFTVNGTVDGDSGILTDNISLASLDQFDPRVGSSNNDSLKNSMSVAQCTLAPSTVETLTITVQDQWESLVITTDWQVLFEENFTGTQEGILKYLGKETADFDVTFSVTFEVSGGGTRQAEITVFKNGVEEIVNSQKFNNNGAVQVTGRAIFELTENDTLQIFVRNTGDTNNLLITQSSLIAARSG